MSKIANWQYCKPIDNTIFYLSPSIRSHLTFAMRNRRGRWLGGRKRGNDRNKSRNKTLTYRRQISHCHLFHCSCCHSCIFFFLFFSFLGFRQMPSQVALGMSRFFCFPPERIFIIVFGPPFYMSQGIHLAKVTEFQTINKFLNWKEPKLIVNWLYPLQ